MSLNVSKNRSTRVVFDGFAWFSQVFSWFCAVSGLEVAWQRALELTKGSETAPTQVQRGRLGLDAGHLKGRVETQAERVAARAELDQFLIFSNQFL